MKKFISVVLVFSLIFVNMSFPVGAIFNSENETEFAGIIQLDGEKYAYQADDNTTLMLGRLDIDILNDIEFQNAMNRNDIPTDVKVVLKERREKVTAKELVRRFSWAKVPKNDVMVCTS